MDLVKGAVLFLDHCIVASEASPVDMFVKQVTLLQVDGHYSSMLQAS